MCERSPGTWVLQGSVGIQTDEPVYTYEEWLYAGGRSLDGPGSFPLLLTAYLVCVGLGFGVVIGRCSVIGP